MGFTGHCGDCSPFNLLFHFLCDILRFHPKNMFHFQIQSWWVTARTTECFPTLTCPRTTSWSPRRWYSLSRCNRQRYLGTRWSSGWLKWSSRRPFSTRPPTVRSSHLNLVHCVKLVLLLRYIWNVPDSERVKTVPKTHFFWSSVTAGGITSEKRVLGTDGLLDEGLPVMTSIIFTVCPQMWGNSGPLPPLLTPAPFFGPWWPMSTGSLVLSLDIVDVWHP